MKYLLVVIISLLLVACATNNEKIPCTELKEKVFNLNAKKKNVSERSFLELEKESAALNKYVGSYPPKFKNENQRQEIYVHWLSLVSDAEAYSLASTEKEKSYYILAELYRQGHNLDVRGSAERSKDNLDSCLSYFPKSVPCNFSASYFYLSIIPNQETLGKAEKSLNVLREHFYPKQNPEVEGGFVFLYIYQRNVEKTRTQIDKYIANFPNTRRAEEFLVIKANLGDEIRTKQY